MLRTTSNKIGTVRILCTVVKSMQRLHSKCSVIRMESERKKGKERNGKESKGKSSGKEKKIGIKSTFYGRRIKISNVCNEHVKMVNRIERNTE